MKKQYYFLISLLIFIICCRYKETKSNTILGNFYVDIESDRYACPMYMSFNKDYVFIQYQNGGLEKLKFKISYQGMDTLLIEDEKYKTISKIIKKEKYLELINLNQSIIIGSKSMKLIEIGETKKKSLTGYWYSENFRPNKEKQEVFLAFYENSYLIKGRYNGQYFENDMAKWQMNSFGNIHTYNLEYNGGGTDVYIIDNIFDKEIQLYTRNCLNRKFYINLEQIDSIEFSNTKIHEKNHDKIELPQINIEDFFIEENSVIE